MKYTLIQAIFSILISVISFSCSSPKYLYTPATANLLQVDSANDIKVAVNYATKDNFELVNNDGFKNNGVDIQSVYAINSKIAVKLDGYYKWEQTESARDINNMPYEKINYKKRGIEISGGLYNFSKQKKGTVFQLFAGIGLGKFDFIETKRNDNTLYFHNTNYFKTFIQPSATLKLSKFYFLIFGGRLSLLKYTNTKTNYSNISNYPLGYIETKPSYFFDFMVSHEFGFNKLKFLRFQLQTGKTILLTSFTKSEPNGFIKQQYDYTDTWLSFGCILNFKQLSAQK